MNDIYTSLLKKTVADMFQPTCDELNKIIPSGVTSSVGPEEGYKCIHLGIEQFVGNIKGTLEHYFNNKQGIKFLDVGCGVGQKVYLANMLGCEAYGLDLRMPYVEAARKLLSSYKANIDEWGNPKVYKPINWEKRIFQDDALIFEGYKDFDLIYFYCPISDYELQRKLEIQIIKHAKNGAVVMGFIAHIFGKNFKSKDRNSNKELLKKYKWNEVVIESNYHRLYSYWIKGNQKKSVKKLDIQQSVYYP